MKPTYFTIAFLGLLAIILQPVSAGTVPTIAIELRSETTANYETNLEIPRISHLGNRDIQNKINAVFSTDIIDFAQNLTTEAAEYAQDVAVQGWELRPYQILTRVQTNQITTEFISISVLYYQYTGGAHGFTEKRSYNFNLQTGKEIKLADLFPEGTDYQTLINQEIQEQLVKREGLEFVPITEDQPFYLKEGQLVVYYGLYEIGPYVAGIPEFIITEARLKI